MNSHLKAVVADEKLQSVYSADGDVVYFLNEPRPVPRETKEISQLVYSLFSEVDMLIDAADVESSSL